MTPFELSFLIHCHICFTAPYEPWSAAAEDAAEKFLKLNMITYGDSEDENVYKLTQKGVFFIEHLLNIPFPEVEFRIPERQRRRPLDIIDNRKECPQCGEKMDLIENPHRSDRIGATASLWDCPLCSYEEGASQAEIMNRILS